MSSEKYNGLARQVHGTSADRIRRMDNNRQALCLSPDYDRIPGSSRPVNGTSAQQLARVSIVHEARRYEEQSFAATAEYDSQEMVAIISPIPLRITEDGTIIYV